jgi:hypothetical protein
MSEIKYLDLNGLQNYTDDLKTYLSGNYAQVLEVADYIWVNPVELNDITDNYDTDEYEIIYCEQPILMINPETSRPMSPGFVYRSKSTGVCYPCYTNWNTHKISKYSSAPFSSGYGDILYRLSGALFVFNSRGFLPINEPQDYLPFDYYLGAIRVSINDEIYGADWSIAYSPSIHYPDYGVTKPGFVYYNRKTGIAHCLSETYFLNSDLKKYQDNPEGNIRQDKIFKCRIGDTEHPRGFYVFHGDKYGLNLIGDPQIYNRLSSLGTNLDTLETNLDTLETNLTSISNDVNNNRIDCSFYKTVGSYIELNANKKITIIPTIPSNFTIYIINADNFKMGTPYIYDLVFETSDTAPNITFRSPNLIEWVKQPVFEAGKKYLLTFTLYTDFPIDAPEAPSSGANSMGSKTTMIGMYAELN